MKKVVFSLFAGAMANAALANAALAQDPVAIGRHVPMLPAHAYHAYMPVGNPYAQPYYAQPPLPVAFGYPVPGYPTTGSTPSAPFTPAYPPMMSAPSIMTVPSPTVLTPAPVTTARPRVPNNRLTRSQVVEHSGPYSLMDSTGYLERRYAVPVPAEGE